LAREAPVWSLPQVAPHCARLAISHNGAFAALVGAADTLLVVNLANGQVRHLTTGGQLDETAVGFSPDDTALVTGASDTYLRVWSLASGQGTPIGSHDWPLLDAAFVTGARFVLAGDSQSIRLWDVESGKEVRRLVDATQATGGNPSWFSRLNFSADGAFVIAGSASDVVVFDLAGGQIKQRWKGQHKDIVAVRLFPGNQRAISAARDQSAVVWDVETGNELAAGLGVDFGAVSAIAIDGAGGQFAMADVSLDFFNGVFGPTLTVWSISAPAP
jgi:WD40 repeat protein